MYINQKIINDIIENKITKLNLRNKDINRNDIKLLLDTLKFNLSIEIIDFTNSYIEDIIPLIEFLNINKTIKIIDFTRSKIKNIEELFKYLTKTKNEILNTLEFYDCKLECSKEFLEFIKYNKTIENINLSSNPFLNNIKFYNELKYTSIKNIFICENNITDINYISNILNVNKSIQSLYICSNLIDNINSLIESLKNNNTLTFLDLSHNYITDINRINEIFDNNNTIKYISFCDNKINNINEEIEKLIQNKNIEININDNPINKFINYYIVFYKYFENKNDYNNYLKNDYYNYLNNDNKIYFYGSDIKTLLKNKQFNQNDLYLILKFNTNTNSLTIYNINDNNLTYNIENKQFDNNKIIINNYPIEFPLELEDLKDNISQSDILNDLIKKHSNYSKYYFIISIKHIYDFSDSDISKNYSLSL